MSDKKNKLIGMKESEFQDYNPFNIKGKKSYKDLGIKNEDEFLKKAGERQAVLKEKTKTITEKGAFVKRRLKLSGAPKLSKALDVAKQVGKRTLVGKIVDTGVKVGAGAAAGYEYAKEKFKKPKKKSEGGFMIGKGEDYIKDLL